MQRFKKFISREIRKKYKQYLEPLGRPTNLTRDMEIKICERMRDGYSNNKILSEFPVGLKTIKEIRLKRNYFLDLP